MNKTHRVRSVETGRHYVLSPSLELSSGGEGRIYALPGSGQFAAKIYHAPTTEQASKLTVMIKHLRHDPIASHSPIVCAWPRELLVTDDRRQAFVGFIMPRVHHMHSVVEVYNPQARQRHAPHFDYRYLHRCARNLAIAAGTVHRKNWIIRDFSEVNALVASTAMICLIDADSFQVRDPVTGKVYRCVVGRPEFTAPELVGKLYADADGTVAHDLFALGVLIWRILQEGFHPFDARYLHSTHSAPGIGRRIAAGHFPHAGLSIPWEPPRYAPPLNILDPVIQVLMLRCFRDGHTNPLARPTIQEWIAALKHAEQSLVSCRQSSHHWYGNHLQTCPWCERTRLLGGIDPFPANGSLPIRPLGRQTIRTRTRNRIILSPLHVRQTTAAATTHHPNSRVGTVSFPFINSSPPPLWVIVLLLIIGLVLVSGRWCDSITNLHLPRFQPASVTGPRTDIGAPPAVAAALGTVRRAAWSTPHRPRLRPRDNGTCTNQKERLV